VRIAAFFAAVNESDAALHEIAGIKRGRYTTTEELSEQFLIYYWRHEMPIPVYGNSHEYKPAGKLLYCPKLKNSLDQSEPILNEIAIADVPDSLTLDQAELLGFQLYPKAAD